MVECRITLYFNNSTRSTLTEYEIYILYRIEGKIGLPKKLRLRTVCVIQAGVGIFHALWAQLLLAGASINRGFYLQVKARQVRT